MALLALAVLPLLGPWFTHPALDAAGAAEWTGLTSAQVHTLSDRSVEELLLGPGAFDFAGPDGQSFYGPSERAHLRDARLLLGICLVAGGLAILVLAWALVRRPDRRSATWRVISRTGLATAVAVVLLGFLSIFAFDSLFTLFHRVFFPGGNWSFDPATQHLVQLYPFRFWQLAAAALGSLLLVLGLGTWLLGRVLAARAPAGRASEPTSG